MNATERFKERFSAIDALYANSQIYTEAKASFDEGLVRYSFTEQEKASAYADFMAKAFQTSLATATDAALRLGLTYEQEVSESNKREAEISAVEEQVLKIKIEQDLVLASKELTLSQIKSERLREGDLEASIRLKEQQLTGVHIANVAENEKRKVLIQTANDNAIIKRAEHLNNYLKVLSDDQDFKITEAGIHERIKEEILSIGERSLTSEDIGVSRPSFTPFQSKSGERVKIEPVFKVISRSKPQKGESVEFYCLAAGCNQKEVSFTWRIEGETYNAQRISHIFKNRGNTEIICEVIAGGETYALKEVVSVL